MTAPDRIWIDAWGGNWSPRAGGTQEIEYIRADLIPAALVVPEVRALVEAAQDVKDFRYDPNIGIKLNILEERLAALRAGGDA